MSEKILIVDDEKEIADLVALYLKNEGYEVYKFYTANEALSCIRQEEMDLAVLDIMLPGMSGFELCSIIREKYTYPVIMLTAKGGDMDKILGLEYGADDYISKPFNILEVKARIKAIMRRSAKRRIPRPCTMWRRCAACWTGTTRWPCAPRGRAPCC